MIIHGKKKESEKEAIRLIRELRGESGGATATDRPLTTLEKIALMAEAVQEAPLPSEAPKAGYMWRRYYDATGVIMWEEVPDPDYVEPEGTFTNPIEYTEGMTVTAGLFYTDGENVWECLQDGTPEGFDDPAYFDILK